MALVKCVECSKQISDIAEICPSCGCDIKIYKENKKKREARRDAGYERWRRKKKERVKCISCEKKFNRYVLDTVWEDLYKRNPDMKSDIYLTLNSKIKCTNVFLGEYTCIECQKGIPEVTKSETPSYETKPVSKYMIIAVHILAWVISLGICYYVFFLMK